MMEVWKIIFLSKWVMAVGSMLIFQGVFFVKKHRSKITLHLDVPDFGSAGIGSMVVSISGEPQTPMNPPMYR